MEAKSTVFRHWDDVVFENRNKLYGAYLLRRAYANRLLSGLALTILLVALILSLQNIFTAKKVIPPPAPSLDGTIVIINPPIVNPERRRREATQHRRVNSGRRAVLVTRGEVIEPEQVEAVTEYVSDIGTENGDVGTPDGIGTVAMPDPQPVVEEPFREFAELMPQYEGGLEAMMKFIQKKIRYPRAPRSLGIDGTVFVRFVVNGDGSVSNVEVIRGVHPDYDREAVRVISMLPAWKGGRHNGRPVSVRMVLPIKFDVR